MEYFGNMVLWAFPRMQARELLSSSYAAVVGAIRDAVARVDAESATARAIAVCAVLGIAGLSWTEARALLAEHPDLEAS